MPMDNYQEDFVPYKTISKQEELEALINVNWNPFSRRKYKHHGYIEGENPSPSKLFIPSPERRLRNMQKVPVPRTSQLRRQLLLLKRSK